MRPIELVPLFAMLGEAAATAAPDRVSLRELPDHRTEAVIEIAAAPAAVYAAMTDYGAWPRYLTDVTSLRVLGGTRDDAVLRVGSRVLGRTSTIQFHNTPPTMIRYTLVSGPPGGRSNGEIALEPLANGTRTRVRATMYLDVVGVPGVLFSDSRTRTMRQGKLRRDLEDLASELEGRS